MRTTLPALLVLLASALMGSCESAPSQPDLQDDMSLLEAADSDVASAEKKADAKRKKARNNARKLRKEIDEKESELHVARLEFDLGESKAASSLASAHHSVEEARLDLGIAERALAAFVEIEMPMKLARVELRLDRSGQSVVEAKQNLEGMLQIYDDEVEARSKDEILMRSERRLAFAERELALANQRATFDRENEIPNERRKFERAVNKAAHKLQKAEDSLGQGRLQQEIDSLGRRDDLAEINKELKKQKANLRKAEVDAGERE